MSEIFQQKYIDLLFRLIYQMIRLIVKRKFLVDKGKLYPLAENFIAGNSGYLLPTDLEEFYKAINLCLYVILLLYYKSVQDYVEIATVLCKDQEYLTHQDMI